VPAHDGGTTVAHIDRGIGLNFLDQSRRGNMQVEPMGGSFTIAEQRQQTIIGRVPCETEVVVSLSNSGRARRGDYPCDCRSCREAAAAHATRRISALAAIDVYDLPDEAGSDSASYFH